MLSCCDSERQIGEDCINGSKNCVNGTMQIENSLHIEQIFGIYLKYGKVIEGHKIKCFTVVTFKTYLKPVFSAT